MKNEESVTTWRTELLTELLTDYSVELIIKKMQQKVTPSNSTSVSLPNVIQRIVSNEALPAVEGELRNRFNTRNAQAQHISTRVESTPLPSPLPRSLSLPQSIAQGPQALPVATSSVAVRPVPLYNPLTPYGRPRSSSRRRKRTVNNVFKDEPAEKSVYKDFVLLSSNTINTPIGKERSKLEKDGFVVHAVPLKQSQNEKEVEVVNAIFAHKLVQSSTGEKRYRVGLK